MMNDNQIPQEPSQMAELDQEVQSHAVGAAKRIATGLAMTGALLGGMAGVAHAEDAPSSQPAATAEPTSSATPTATEAPTTDPSAEPTPAATDTPTEDPTPEPLPSDIDQIIGTPPPVVTVAGGGEGMATTPKQAQPNAKTLPRTGPASPVDLVPLGGAGGAAIVLGVGAVVAGRKREEDAPKA